MSLFLHILPALICFLFLHSCGQEPQNTKPFSTTAPALTQKPEKNLFADKTSWGNAHTYLDFSGKIYFKDDPRIHQLHKDTWPQLNNSHVLWRVTHDGSCWISAQLTLLLFQMIEGGEPKFHKVLAKMQDFAEQNNKTNDLKAFFDIFKIIEGNLSHRFALDFYNHENIYQVLDKGMRLMLATYYRSRPNDNWLQTQLKSLEASPKSWGLANQFQELFALFELELAYIDLFRSSLNGDPDISASSFGKRGAVPKMMVIHTSPSFIDVLVEKSFSDLINGQSSIN